MLLRKHIGAGRIIEISQVELERVVLFKIQHLNEMGDVCIKHLYLELMGKHSNIIFCDDNNCIIDSIKHVPASLSSVREVLPQRDYFIPKQEGKISPLKLDFDYFIKSVLNHPISISKAILSSYVGISPIIANEICYRAGLDGDFSTASLSDAQKQNLFNSFEEIINILNKKDYLPCIFTNPSNNEPLDFAPFKMKIYEDYSSTEYSSISEVLVDFYSRKNIYTNIRQKSSDLRKIISNHIERCVKKLDLQLKQMKDTQKMDKYKLYGELLHTYGYNAKEGDKSITVINYYNNEELTIPLDATLSATDNAKKYFDKYSKLKRTKEALETYIAQSKDSLEHLKSMDAALFIAENESDLNEIRKELCEYGFIKKNANNKKEKFQKSKPLHFIDDNGFDIYVGKNNYQNDELTFKFATGNDWWFHTKEIHGSHVIVKCNNTTPPDSTFEYAAELAAYYSSGRNTPKVEIDYSQKKNIKKPQKAAAGFVVYYTNYSIMVSPTLEHVRLVD